jgi:hypothetical protein
MDIRKTGFEGGRWNELGLYCDQVKVYEISGTYVGNTGLNLIGNLEEKQPL